MLLAFALSPSKPSALSVFGFCGLIYTMTTLTCHTFSTRVYFQQNHHVFVRIFFVIDRNFDQSFLIEVIDIRNYPAIFIYIFFLKFYQFWIIIFNQTLNQFSIWRFFFERTSPNFLSGCDMKLTKYWVLVKNSTKILTRSFFFLS